MPILQKDFSAGWVPADDKINGRQNGLLQMDNVELDTNGALAMIGGTATVHSGYPANAHSLFSRVVGGSRHDYLALTDGHVYRDTTSLATGGDTTNAAFASAFDFVLIASGTKLLKDNGTTAVNLGVLPPTAAPVAAGGALSVPYKTIGDLVTNKLTPVGSSATPGGTYLEMTASAAGICVVQTRSGTGDPHNTNLLTNTDIPIFATNTGFGLDSDTINFTGYVVSPIGKTLKIDVLLVAGDAGGNPVTDFYTYKIDLGTVPYDPFGVFSVAIRRDQFERMGNGVQDWSTTYGYRLTFISTIAADVLNVFATNVGTTEIRIQGGSNAQNGTYQYVQVNVNNTGSYFGQSPMGPISGNVILPNNQALVVPQNPGGIDTQVNEVWIFRRGGLLDQFYRVAVRTTYGSFVDAVGDQAALELNVTLNINLINIQSIPDKIFTILGPIQQRWYYFTSKLMYPSDYNNPDAVDASKAIRTTAANGEAFLWAKQIADALVRVGTSVDMYLLSGTFATLPDGTIDIFYHSIGCKFPPIAYDADVYEGAVVYLASDGWRQIGIDNSNPLLVSPNSDNLYRGKDAYGYFGIDLTTLGTPPARVPVCIGQNKLWCFITSTNRCEVYDMIRKYWRTFDYGLGDASQVTTTQDGLVFVFYKNDKILRLINNPHSKLVDGVGQQTIKLLWTVRGGEDDRRRKDSETFKSRLYTGGSNLGLFITNDLNVAAFVGFLNSAAAGLDKFIDLSVNAAMAIVKTYQVQLTGTLPDFLLEDWSIDYDMRPPQVSFIRILNQNYGSAAKKRIRNTPIVIDTLGGDVLWTPVVDNTVYPTTTLNTSIKSTKNIFFTQDAFGVDYGGTLHSTNGLFEFFEFLQPTLVQVLPVAKRFDQVGPEELFKYGKIKEFDIRVMPFGGTVLPYTIFMADSDKLDGSITIVDGKEDNYSILVPKGTSGRIARITFGPTNFDFHRFYVRLKTAASGSDTELQWITVGGE